MNWIDNNYIKRMLVFKRFTEDLAVLSKCEERKVAAVITDTNFTQVYSIGLNGGPKGLADCLCITEGKYGCIHAEINALIKCADQYAEKVMFVTLSPCKQCATAIINSPSRITAVYYFEQWKDTSGLLLLKNAGIRVESL